MRWYAKAFAEASVAAAVAWCGGALQPATVAAAEREGPRENPVESRLDDLDRRLDKLAQDVEQLRDQMRAHHPEPGTTGTSFRGKVVHRSRRGRGSNGVARGSHRECRPAHASVAPRSVLRGLFRRLGLLRVRVVVKARPDAPAPSFDVLGDRMARGSEGRRLGVGRDSAASGVRKVDRRTGQPGPGGPEGMRGRGPDGPGPGGPPFGRGPGFGRERGPEGGPPDGSARTGRSRGYAWSRTGWPGARRAAVWAWAGIRPRARSGRWTAGRVSQDREVPRVCVVADRMARALEGRRLGVGRDSAASEVRKVDRRTGSQDREVPKVNAASDPMASVPRGRHLNAGGERNVVEVRETTARKARHRTGRSRNAVPNSV